MQKKWWKESVMYQIYPRSFKDSNADGIGDIKGIISKLDYLKELGVDIIWLGPVYDSPNDDNGYDISDYYSIHPEFGTMQEFDELLVGLHARGIRLIMDVVVNHTSDEHDWFEKSKSSKENEYRDYYFWREGKDGGPPNNWVSFFGGSAWELDEASGQYYLHLFTKKQPDLNWENPTVRQEVKDILKFWLDKGIDGFRMDVIPLISKRLPFQDSDAESFSELVETAYSNGPKVHEYINELYEDVLQHYDIMTVGEGPGISTMTAMNYIHPDRRELNMIFQLEHMFLGFGEKGKFDQQPYELTDLLDILIRWDDKVSGEGWNNIFLDNHDFARLVSRWGNDNEFRYESATLFATLLLTFRGTPCIYQGSEIGMTNVRFETIEEYDDVETLNFYEEFVVNGDMDKDEFMKAVYKEGRDNVRTPIQWDSSENAGFTKGKPWLKMNPNFKEINSVTDKSSSKSIFNYYKELIAYRKGNDDLIYGELHILEKEKNLFVYNRVGSNEKYCILLNMNGHEKQYSIDLKSTELIMSNYPSIQNTDEIVHLRPWESMILKYVK